MIKNLAIRFVVTVLIIFLLLVGYWGLRILLAPVDTEVPAIEFSIEDSLRLRSAITDATINATDLQAHIQSAHVLLLGETHFSVEPMEFLTKVIEGESRQVTLLLELAPYNQPLIDGYLDTGDETLIDTLYALPFQAILRWVYEHPGQVRKVQAADENPQWIYWMRKFKTDTRNRTMSKNVLSAHRQYPNDLIILYGGQMHMTLAGRYRYDVSNRRPAGARILESGFPKERLLSVMLFGDDAAAILSVWDQTGIVSLNGALGQEPYHYFIDYPVFRAPVIQNLADYFVNLGTLTSVEVE